MDSFDPSLSVSRLLPCVTLVTQGIPHDNDMVLKI